MAIASGPALWGIVNRAEGIPLLRITPAPSRAAPVCEWIIKDPAAGTPDPVSWAPPSPDSTPTHQEDQSATNAAKTSRRSIGARDRVLDASHRSNHWALDDSPDEHHPIFGLHQEPDPRLASWAIPEDRQALLSARVG